MFVPKPDQINKAFEIWCATDSLWEDYIWMKCQFGKYMETHALTHTTKNDYQKSQQHILRHQYDDSLKVRLKNYLTHLSSF